ncbi:hypothetical protein LguiA_000959 [Lonicera macranthoides]
MVPKKDKVLPPSSKPAKFKGGKQKMKKWSKGKQKDKVVLNAFTTFWLLSKLHLPPSGCCLSGAKCI